MMAHPFVFWMAIMRPTTMHLLQEIEAIVGYRNTHIFICAFLKVRTKHKHFMNGQDVNLIVQGLL
jgi:hypothetical protein